MNPVSIRLAHNVIKPSNNVLSVQKNNNQNSQKSSSNTACKTGNTADYKKYSGIYKYNNLPNINFGMAFIKKSNDTECMLSESEKKKIDRFKSDTENKLNRMRKVSITYGKQEYDELSKYSSREAAIEAKMEEFYKQYIEDENIPAIKYCLTDKTGDFMQTKGETSPETMQINSVLNSLLENGNPKTIAKVLKLEANNESLGSKLAKQKNYETINLFMSLLGRIDNPKDCYDILNQDNFCKSFEDNIEFAVKSRENEVKQANSTVNTFERHSTDKVRQALNTIKFDRSGTSYCKAANEAAIDKVSAMVYKLCTQTKEISAQDSIKLLVKYDGHLTGDAENALNEFFTDEMESFSPDCTNEEYMITSEEKEEIDQFQKNLKTLYLNTYGRHYAHNQDRSFASRSESRPNMFYQAEEFYNKFAEEGNIPAIKYCLKDPATGDFIDGTKSNQNEPERYINRWNTACMLDALHKKSDSETIAKVLKFKIPNENGHSLLISKLSKQEDPYGIYVFASMLKDVKDPNECYEVLTSHCISKDFKDNIKGKQYYSHEQYIEANKLALNIVNSVIRDLCTRPDGISDIKARNLIKMYEKYLTPDILGIKNTLKFVD